MVEKEQIYLMFSTASAVLVTSTSEQPRITEERDEADRVSARISWTSRLNQDANHNNNDNCE